MSDTPQRHPITLKRFALRLEGMGTVRVRRDVEYRAGSAGPLTLDLYYPHASGNADGHPAVVIVAGYPDVGVPLRLGCVFKDMEMSISLAQLIAASGMSAVTYTTSQSATDVMAVLDYLTTHAGTLGLDGSLGLWATSGNVPVALGALVAADRPPIAAAILSQASRWTSPTRPSPMRRGPTGSSMPRRRCRRPTCHRTFRCSSPARGGMRIPA